jgi:hypothetical protein
MKVYSRITTVPFAGFYESYHDSELDMALQMMFADDNGNPFDNGALEMHANWAVDWQAVHTAYAMQYMLNVAAEFGIDLIPEKMVSPREYNFTTDRLFAYIPLKEVYRLRKATPPALLEACIRESFTSYDGFYSHYPNDVSEWGLMNTWDHNQIGTLVKAYIRSNNNGEDMDQDMELDLMDRDRGNGMLDTWIDENCKGIGRFYAIREYLQRRKDRGEKQRNGLRFLGA